MKLKFIILLALLTAGTVRGQFFFLSESQSVSASATVSVHQISSNFNYTADSGNLGGDVSVSDPNTDRFGNSGETAYATSLARLATGISSSRISFSSLVQVAGSGPYDQSGGSAFVTAISVFQVSFNVSSAQMFEMSCDNFFFDPNLEELTHLDFSLVLSSANQGYIGGWGNQYGQQIPVFNNPFSGLLEPGDVYTLQCSMEAGGDIPDPMGDLTAVQADVTLTAVPEPSSIFLLGLGALGLVAMRNPTQFCTWYLSYNTLQLSGLNRISLSEQQGGGDMQRPAQTSFQVLFRDDTKRAEVRRIIYDAFGLYLTIDPTHLGILRLKLSPHPPQSDLEERGIHAESVKFHGAALPVELWSDGVKAFVGIITEVIAGDPQVLLIDEPEAFLHPSLSFKLGREIATASSRVEKRLFVSTHSPHFVMGCIQSGAPVNKGGRNQGNQERMLMGNGPFQPGWIRAKPPRPGGALLPTA